jgi:hypothetical protein
MNAAVVTTSSQTQHSNINSYICIQTQYKTVIIHCLCLNLVLTLHKHLHLRSGPMSTHPRIPYWYVICLLSVPYYLYGGIPCFIFHKISRSSVNIKSRHEVDATEMYVQNPTWVTSNSKLHTITIQNASSSK